MKPTTRDLLSAPDLSAGHAVGTVSEKGSPLAEGYYADNFHLLLDTVVGRYRALLRDDERAFVETFSTLDRDARRLYVRLVARKGRLVRRDSLRYDEIGDIDAALDRLVAVGFVDAGDDLPVASWLNALRVAELRKVAGEAGITPPTGARKADWVAALVVVFADRPSALRHQVETIAPLVAPRHRSRVRLFCLLFFGNLYQDWNAFVLHDLGLTRFESYDLDPALRRFTCREAIDQTILLGDHRARVERWLASGALDEARAEWRTVANATWHPEVRHRVDKVALLVGRALERAGQAHAAARCYAAAETPPARERHARVLASLGALDAAIRLCDEMASAPRDEVERVVAPRLGDRLRRKRGERLPVRRRRRRPERALVLRDAGTGSIEQSVLDHLAAEGQRGFFAQNWLWKSLFGLAFWDIVFAPVPGAFEQPFQLGPLDLGRPDFRRARAEAVERRLAGLRERARVGDTLLATFDEKDGVANALVSWHPDARADVALALDRLTGAHLAWVFDRLSREIRRYRRGFPDLFVMTDEAPGFALYEVKGPGDQLRPEQGRWLDYLNEGGLPAFVMPVRYTSPARNGEA